MRLSKNYDMFVDVFRLNPEGKIVQFFKLLCKDQMPAGLCQASDKCNCRALWGMLLQIVLDSCDSRMHLKHSESFWPKQVNQLSYWSNWKMWLSKNYDMFVDVFLDWIQRRKLFNFSNQCAYSLSHRQNFELFQKNDDIIFHDENNIKIYQWEKPTI